VGTTVGGTGSKTFKDGVEHHRNWREISVKEKAMFLKDIHGAAVELMSIGSTNLKKAIEEEAALAKKKETELEETLDILKSF
jgi:hypothetical protein